MPGKGAQILLNPLKGLGWPASTIASDNRSPQARLGWEPLAAHALSLAMRMAVQRLWRWAASRV